jgi:hypothetical protein
VIEKKGWNESGGCAGDPVCAREREQWETVVRKARRTTTTTSTSTRPRERPVLMGLDDGGRKAAAW